MNIFRFFEFVLVILLAKGILCQISLNTSSETRRESDLDDADDYDPDYIMPENFTESYNRNTTQDDEDYDDTLPVISEESEGLNSSLLNWPSLSQHANWTTFDISRIKSELESMRSKFKIWVEELQKNHYDVVGKFVDLDSSIKNKKNEDENGFSEIEGIIDKYRENCLNEIKNKRNSVGGDSSKDGKTKKGTTKKDARIKGIKFQGNSQKVEDEQSVKLLVKEVKKLEQSNIEMRRKLEMIILD